jgi:hypothetical protein
MMMLRSAKGDPAQHYANLNDYTRNGFPARWMLGKYWQIDEAIYWHFLEMLPPETVDHGFRMIERLTGDIAATYLEIDGDYWCAMTDRTSTPPDKMVRAIRKRGIGTRRWLPRVVS